MKENLIKRLLTSVKCAACGEHYATGNISILDHAENLWFLEASCSACDIQCLVAVVIKEEPAPEVITDLTEAERPGFEKVSMVTADEVLDIHEFLRNFDGDFSQLFNQRKA